MKIYVAPFLALASTGFARANADPAPPPLTFLLTANVTATEPINVGSVAGGTRIVYPIVGGTFEGPLLNGTLADVGADFSLVATNGAFGPDGISLFQTSDGANILFRDKGHQLGDYVYGSGSFETGSEKYAWLNTVVPITRAKVSTGDDGAAVSLEIFLVI
ncbi:hypothetical protein ACO1O0_006072 [Amphichorda felina]